MNETADLNAQMSKATTTLATMLDYLGLNATVKAEEKNGKIILKASSDDAGRIIGRKGQTLESLQFLVNRMMIKTDNVFPKIFIDVDGYSKSDRRDSREDSGRGESYRRNRDDSRGAHGGFRRNSECDGKHHETNTHQSNEDRDIILKQQALDAAKEVKRWGDAVTLPPMNSHERRIIHMTLKEESGIVTESVETENPRLKRVVVKAGNKSDAEHASIVQD